jgi:hypothetical protein
MNTIKITVIITSYAQKKTDVNILGNIVYFIAAVVGRIKESYYLNHSTI